MPKLVNIVGMKFSRLTVLERVADRERGCPRWRCLCVCGNETEAESGPLKNGGVKSCGCLASERARAGINKRHGMSRTPIYGVWSKMKDRCTNTKVQSYAAYGGRGITVCERWQSFDLFFADMGERPSPNHSIDRIDNDGPYSPENCRWVGSVLEQRKNCRDNRRITYKGETLILAEWERKTGFSADVISSRIAAGWDIDRVMTEPTWNQKSITVNGQTKTIMQWSRLTGIGRTTIRARLQRGWPPEKLFLKP